MIALLILSAAIFAAYLGLFTKKYGLPWSLSETCLKLEKKWLFTIVLFAVAFTLLPVWIEASPDNIRAFAFFGSAGLLFVGAAPLFTERTQGSVHIIATLVSGLCPILWACFAGLWFVPVISIIGCAVPVIKTRKRPLFWLEVALFAATYIGILVKWIVR